MTQARARLAVRIRERLSEHFFVRLHLWLIVAGVVGAGLEHHLCLGDERHRDEHHQRHVHGLSARGRRGGVVPGHAHDGIAGHRNDIVNNATANVLTGVGSGSPNRLLYSLIP